MLEAIVIFVILALGYGIIRFAKELQAAGEPWSWDKFVPTAIYSVILGILMVVTGVVSLDNLTNLISIQSIMDGLWLQYMTLFTFVLYVWENIAIPFLKNRLTVTEMYPKPATIDPLHKMDTTTRNWLVQDRPVEIRPLILAAVDAAEEAKTIRYAIDSGAWEYLVEYGIVTGGKHYLYKGWFGTGTVLWKAITSACLEAIRSTGKWPDYSKLY